jgi:hypothetical protein
MLTTYNSKHSKSIPAVSHAPDVLWPFFAVSLQIDRSDLKQLPKRKLLLLLLIN